MLNWENSDQIQLKIYDSIFNVDVKGVSSENKPPSIVTGTDNLPNVVTTVISKQQQS